MRTITTISIVAALGAGLLAYFNHKSTQEYFGYFQAEKVLIESLDRHRDKGIKNEDSTDPKTFGNFYRILSTDTHYNLYEVHLLFSDGGKYTFQVIKDSDNWVVTYFETK